MAQSNNDKSATTIQKIGLGCSWIILILITLTIFAFSTTWGIYFTIGSVLIILITCHKSNKLDNNQSENSTVKEFLKQNISKEITSFNEISKVYFNTINDAVNNIVNFYYTIKNHKDFEEVINKHINLHNRKLDMESQIYLLFCLDLKTCHTQLGHDIDLKSKEGLGFLIFMHRAWGIDPVEFWQLNNLRNMASSSQESLEGLVNSASLSGKVLNYFILADLLSVYDEDLQKKYMVLLYRYASIVAKSDETISLKEEKWLSELLKLSGNEAISVISDSLANYDPLFEEVARIIVIHQQGSTSLIQRKFSIGYNRASKIMDELEAVGIVGCANGSKARQVLILSEYELENVLKGLKSTSKANNNTLDKKQNKEKSLLKEHKSVSKANPQKELQLLIGLDSVKSEIDTLTNFIKIQQTREERGLKTSSVSYHCIFTGNPGTGKTTVARIVANIYKDLGILAKGHLVETNRSGLVAEYVGQTAVKTNKIIDTALDGVLFIDEAYSLISNSENDYGKEAIATLLKRMEDDRSRLIVILAGYTAEMKQLIDLNPGLQSRFNRYIDFPDYNTDELIQIFNSNLKQFDYTISNNAIIKLKDYLQNVIAHKDKNFGNARFVRNLFEKTLERQANRLSKETKLTTEKLSEICIEDLSIKVTI